MERPLEGSSDPRKPPRPCWNCDEERQGQPGESGDLPTLNPGTGAAAEGARAAPSSPCRGGRVPVGGGGGCCCWGGDLGSARNRSRWQPPGGRGPLTFPRTELRERLRTFGFPRLVVSPLLQSGDHTAEGSGAGWGRGPVRAAPGPSHGRCHCAPPPQADANVSSHPRS